MRWGDVPLLCLALAALLVGLGTAPLITTRGEAREGLVVRELVGNSDWVLPRRQGVIASKPPLYHWLAAALVRATGWSDAAVRLPSTLAAWVMVVETFAVGVLLGNRWAAWLAVIILFSTWGFWRSATEARVDMLFAACVAGAIASFAWWVIRGAPRGRLLWWLAATAAVLTKGPAGLVLPALVAIAFFFSRREPRRLYALWSWPAATVALLVTGGWYAAAMLRGGRDFLAVHVKENVARFTGGGEFAPTRTLSWLMMPRYFLGHLAPWNLAIPVDLRRWWLGERDAVARRLLHCWWLSVLGFFSLAAGKRSVYLLPLYPPIALLAAGLLEGRVQSPRGRSLLVGAAVAGALVMLVVSHRSRAAEADRRHLLPLARAASALVPATGAPLYASAGLSENDVLVLAYLLARPLPRKRVTCHAQDVGSYYLRPVPSGDAATPLDRLVLSGDVELARCGVRAE